MVALRARSTYRRLDVVSSLMARRALRPSSRFDVVDHFRVVEEMGSVGGATLKDVLEDPDTGYRYIAKLGGRNSDLEVMTEYAIYLVGRTLPISIADARIARFRGRLRFFSRYFLETTAAEELVHGMQLFNELYDETTVKGVLGHTRREQEMFTVQAIKAAFGAHYFHYGVHVEEELFGGFVAMLTHDALIGVMDRHHENWGVIVQRERLGTVPRFAPLYDSARGLFCNYVEDRLVTEFLGNTEDHKRRLNKYVARARPLIGFTDLVAAQKGGYITHPDLLAAVRRRHGQPVPEVRKGQLTGAVRQRRVEQKAERVEQVAFANAVLANDDDIARQLDIQGREVAKVRDRYPRQLHTVNSLTPS
jgi:hypothetical protein